MNKNNNKLCKSANCSKPVSPYHYGQYNFCYPCFIKWEKNGQTASYKNNNECDFVDEPPIITKPIKKHVEPSYIIDWCVPYPNPDQNIRRINTIIYGDN
jgi:hypothetical protein